MTTLHVLRVFLGPDGTGGNPLGIFLDGAAVAPDRRQRLARDLGFAETVFVDGVVDGIARVRIHTPEVELSFAGHPTIGTAWLIAELGRPVGVLQVPAGDVATWRDGDRTWVTARAAWIHPIALDCLADAAAVDAAISPALGAPGRYVWAWEDEAAGRIRSRTSGPTSGFPRMRRRAPRLS